MISYGILTQILMHSVEEIDTRNVIQIMKYLQEIIRPKLRFQPNQISIKISLDLIFHDNDTPRIILLETV